MKNMYEVEVKSGNKYFVIANDFNDAERVLSKYIERWGLLKHYTRGAKRITLISPVAEINDAKADKTQARVLYEENL